MFWLAVFFAGCFEIEATLSAIQGNLFQASVFFLLVLISIKTAIEFDSKGAPYGLYPSTDS